MKSKLSKNKTAALAAVAAAALCALVFIPSALPAHANSGPGYYFGVGGTVVYPVEDCPIEVESELLTFNINGYPDLQNHVSSEYDSTVTARYTFFNPTAEDITVGMLFPFGGLPEYYSLWSRYGYDDFDDSALLSVTTGADDAPADFSLRISYDDEGNSYIGSYFNFEAARENLYSEPLADDILFYECPVTAYGIAEDGAAELLDESELLVAKFTADDDYYVFSDSLSYGYDDSQLWVELDVGENIYFAGSVPADLQFYSREYVYAGGYNGVAYAEAVDTPIASPEPSQVTTFIEFARSIKPQVLEGVSDVDWFNYIVRYVYSNASACISVQNLKYNSETMMRWLEYEVTIPAGGTLINSVTVPVYPDIGIDSDPFTYEYHYYLSPASHWADFGTLTVRINSGDYLLDSSVGDFSIADGVYEATFSTLPSGELEFTLCTSPDPVYKRSGFFLFVLILVYAAALVVTYVVGLIIVIAVVRHDKKKFFRGKK